MRSLPGESSRAELTPAYGMREVGGWGIRGWRVFCPGCGFLSDLYTNHFNGRAAAETHRRNHVKEAKRSERNG